MGGKRGRRAFLCEKVKANEEEIGEVEITALRGKAIDHGHPGL